MKREKVLDILGAVVDVVDEIRTSGLKICFNCMRYRSIHFQPMIGGDISMTGQCGKREEALVDGGEDSPAKNCDSFEVNSEEKEL